VKRYDIEIVKKNILPQKGIVLSSSSPRLNKPSPFFLSINNFMNRLENEIILVLTIQLLDYFSN